MAPNDAAVEAVLAYHRRTKHHLHRYAASPGYLDWATQPDPFRTFDGADRVELPLQADRLAVAYDALYRPGAVPPLPLDRTSVAMLFELALGLSAWKQYAGNRWALRCNPSSGNLHPTEGYAILPAMPGLAAGVYHYVSRDHALEQRCASGRARRPAAGCGAPSRVLSRGALLDSLARGLEVRRARLPLLPARCRPCHRRRALCGRDAGVVGRR